MDPSFDRSADPRLRTRILLAVATALCCVFVVWAIMRERTAPRLDVGTITAPADAARVTEELHPGGIGAEVSGLLRTQSTLDSLRER